MLTVTKVYSQVFQSRLVRYSNYIYGVQFWSTRTNQWHNSGTFSTIVDAGAFYRDHCARFYAIKESDVFTLYQCEPRRVY